jgi:hypothetical protein
MTSTCDWDGSHIAFEGDVAIFGEHFPLRATMTRTGPDAFTILNEQRMPDGRYVRVDEYRYTRAAQQAPH